MPHSASGIEAILWAQLYPEEVEAIIGLDMSVPAFYEAIYDEDKNMTEVYPVVAIVYDEEAAFVCSYTTAMYIEGNVKE